MFRSTGSLLVLCFVVLAATAQDRPATPGQSYPDSLSGTDAHAYTLDLPADQFVYGEALQHTLDVVVTIKGPDDAVVGTFDNPARGPETFQFTTEASGTYRIEVSPFEEQAGRYTFTVLRAEPVATTPEGRTDQLMAPYSSTATPGGVVAVVEGGEVAFARPYGMANLTYDIAYELDMPTNIGSVSKQFTAFSIALLAQQGQLSLDDDVRTHIPELKDFGQTITLRHLLTHTSGYREFLNTVAMGGRRLDEGDYISRDELIAIVQRQPELQNAPGAEWNYNNTGYGLLAEVVHRVSGMPFHEWVDANVFTRLGMDHSYVRPHPGVVIPKSTMGYGTADEGYREAKDLGAAMGAGGIYTTGPDLARWIRNLGTHELGGPEVYEWMTTEFVTTDGDSTSYGLGLFIDTQGDQPRVQHGGADTAHRAMLMYYPDLDAGVVVMSNNATFNANAIATQVAEAFFPDAFPQDEADDANADDAASGLPTPAFDPEAYDAEDFDAYVGRYALDAAPNFILTFTREGDQLYTQATGQPRVDIVPTSDSTFALTVVEASLTFHSATDGTVTGLTLHQNGNNHATRLEEAPWVPSDLDVYTGRYFSEELETFYTVAVDDSSLVLRHRRYDDALPLTASTEDNFTAGFPIAEVRFERGDDGRITGFRAANGRTRGVLFVKQD